MLHSLARNHALADGNRRLALAATIAFLGVHGRRLTLSNDQAYGLVITVAIGELDDVPTIADHIRRATEARAAVSACPSATGPGLGHTGPRVCQAV